MAQSTADIGLIGLAVMGENLVLNMESHGFTVAVFNRTVAQGGRLPRRPRPRARRSSAATPSKELVAALKKPRKVMIMVKAGPGGRSGHRGGRPAARAGRHPHRRRQHALTPTPRAARRPSRRKGLLLHRHGRLRRRGRGAARARRIMPGGDPAAWPHVKPIFQAIAAKVARRHALLRLGRRRGRGPLRQDGPQRHRVRRHAAHLRVLPLLERPARPGRRRPARGLRAAGTRASSTAT